MTKLNRRQRRLEARANGAKFEPQYNGKAPISFAEYLKGFGKNKIPARLRKSPLNKEAF